MLNPLVWNPITAPIVDRFDQSDRACGYQIIIFVAPIVFFCNMGNQPHIIFNQSFSGLGIAFFA